MLSGVMHTARTWEKIHASQGNERQRHAIVRLVDGIERKLTPSAYATTTKLNAFGEQKTALRPNDGLLQLSFDLPLRCIASIEI